VRPAPRLDVPARIYPRGKTAIFSIIVAMGVFLTWDYLLCWMRSKLSLATSLQRCIPGEAENPQRNRIENHSCSRLHRAGESEVYLPRNAYSRILDSCGRGSSRLSLCSPCLLVLYSRACRILQWHLTKWIAARRWQAIATWVAAITSAATRP